VSGLAVCTASGTKKKRGLLAAPVMKLHLWLCVLLLIVWYIGDDIAGLTV
jgi:hypothetical protein